MRNYSLYTTSTRLAFVAALLGLALTITAPNARAALAAYWNFDQGSGLIARDVSGHINNHDGTLQGGAETPAWVSGRFGTALDFTWNAPNSPGGGDRVVVPFHDELRLNGPFTISFWYRMDAPTPAGTFPGIMRIGSQSATTGNNIGWGFFRTGNLVHKRGNVQPGIYPAISVGQWYHIALRFSGVNNVANNNIAFINGQQLPHSANWLTNTSTAVFEMGRMDAFDDATLDDLALWHDEAVDPTRIRTLYTVPTSLNLEYDLADVRTLWSIFDGGAGTSNVVKGTMWSYTSSLPGSTTLGDAYLSGGSMYVVLGNGNGVSAPLTLLTGTVSPGGIGTVGSFNLVGSPTITVSNASLLFDLTVNPDPAFNDLIDVTGDLDIVNSTITVNPYGDIAGTYRLFNYTGTKTGSLIIDNKSRYSLAVDDTTPGQINLNVAGANASLTWNSTSSGAWDLTSLNWLNSSSELDRFFQGDAVVFDDSGAFQTNITIANAVFVESITINSATRAYNFTGVGLIGGASEGIFKTGASSATFGTPNTFVGTVEVNEGTLRLGNASGLGATSGGTIIASGATLDLAGNSPGTEPVTVQGAGVNSAGAVVNTGGALSNNGLRGQVTLAGDTTFGGVNRWDVIGGSLVGNGFKLTKVGGPEIALSNLGDTGLGEIEVLQGILTALGNTRLGDPAKTLTVNTNAILAFWATGPTILDKPIVVNSAILRNNTSGGTDITTNLGAVTINGTATVQATANIALMGAISGPGNLVKVNAGTLYLGGANSYSGNTTIGAGRLAVLASGAINNSPRIEVQSGTTFDVSQLSAGFTIASGQTVVGNGTVAGSLNVPTGASVIAGTENVPNTLTINNGLGLSGGTLYFDISSAATEGAGVNDLITVGGNLDLTGVTTINVTPLGILTVGNTYTLINYSGTLTGDAALNLVVSSSSRYTFSVSSATPGKITLTVEGGAAADLVWFGGHPGAENVWDLQTSLNWSDSLGLPSGFFGGDSVFFDDFSSTNVVELVGSLTPASVSVDIGELDYTFQGSGKLSGYSALTKAFGAKLTIANTGVNDFTGPVTVDGGTLQVGTGGTFGNLGSGPITVNLGGSVVYDRSDNLTLGNTLAGNGDFVKDANNLMILSGNNTSFSGTVAANGGTLRPSNANALGDATGGTTIGAGATLDVNGQNLGAEPVSVAGAGVGGNGAIVNTGAGQNNALRFVTLTGDATVGGTVRFDIRANPTGALSTGGNGYNLTKIGSGQFSLVDLDVDPMLGDINVMAGIFAPEGKSGAGDPTKTITVANNATLQFFGRSTVWDKIHVLNGGRNIFNANGASTVNGPVTLNATVTMEVAGISLTIASPIGGTGALTKTGGSPLILLSDATYPGTTTVSAGTLQLGAGMDGGMVAGPLVVNNSTLTVYRSNVVALPNLSGTGTLNVRTPDGLVLSSAVNFGTLNVGQDSAGKLILEPGYVGTHGSVAIGNPANVPGQVVQNGGSITASALFRVGHWPNETSSYDLNGGTLNITGVPGGVPNPGGQPEQNGILYLGIDGTGLFTQTGGNATAHGIVFDARGNTTGTDTFTLNGGRFTVGPSGIKSGNLDANSTYAINLGGGTLASSANWNSVSRMTFTGVNGNTTIDTGANSNALSGALSGVGGLTKVGAGILAINGAAAYEGSTIVSLGTLLVNGSLGSGSGSVSVEGTLAGAGAINDPVQVLAAGTLAPGTSIGTLTINNSLNLAGTTQIEISKNGGVLTNDLVTGISTLTYGGTLTVTASGDTLADGDTFNLFDAATFSGSFATLNLPPLPEGLSWDTSRLAVDGTIRAWVPRPTFSFSRSGNSLSLAWEDEFSDYILEGQTNAPGMGITTNWTPLEVNTNSISISIDPNAGSAFFRLRRP